MVDWQVQVTTVNVKRSKAGSPIFQIRALLLDSPPIVCVSIAWMVA